MWRDEPRWWYAAERSPMAQALAPVGWLYGSLTEQRMRRAQPWRADIPVVCIGNFTAGGTGKTPIAIMVAEYIAALGWEPVFLSRGYGGSHAGPVWVDATAHTSSIVGDEPLLLARHGRTLVARDRAAGARMIQGDGAENRVIVMDDGLQNPAMHKDLRLAVVDGKRGFGNGLCIPAGPLRAPLKFQFALADAMIVNMAGGLDMDGKPLLAGLSPKFAGPVLASTIRPAADSAWIAERPLIAFAGIGTPDRFFATLEALGGCIAERVPFPDHHTFTAADAQTLLLLASAHPDSQLISTEKDFVRLSADTGPLAELAKATRVLPIRATLGTDDNQRMQVLLENAIRGRKAAKQWR